MKEFFLLQPIVFVMLLAYITIKDEIHKDANSLPIERAFWVFFIAYWSLYIYLFYLSK